MSAASDVAREPAAGVTAALAALAAGPLPDMPGARTLDRVCDLVADHLGVALCAWPMPATQAVAVIARAERAAPAAMLYGGGRTSVRNAALVNGTIAHHAEFYGGWHGPPRVGAHPSITVLPAAMAVAESCQASGQEFVAAAAAG